MAQAYITPTGEYYVAADDVALNPQDVAISNPPDSAVWKTYVSDAQALLDKSDTTVLRCVEEGIPVPPEWAVYRSALRAIVGAKVAGDPSVPLPVHPAYPGA